MRIAVIGFGKMGSWLARALAEYNEVAVYDIDRNKIQNTGGLKVLKDVTQLKGFRPQMLINAVNLQNIIGAFDQVKPYLPADCVIADIASIKGALPQYYQKSGFRFGSVHPMFGPTFARMDALKDENAIIISESNNIAASFFRTFFSRYGLHITECSFAEHDDLMAYSLTLPFASSIVFAACLNRQIVRQFEQSELLPTILGCNSVPSNSPSTVPGTTFARHRKIAQGLLNEDDFLLAEVLFNPHSLAQLEKINSWLELLKHIIKARDYEEAQKFFAKLRENLV